MSDVQLSTVCTVVTHYMKKGLMLLWFPALWAGADQAGLSKMVNGEDILVDSLEQDTVTFNEAPSPVQEDTCREKSQRRNR
jgi:hypothetical protein